MQKIDFVLTWVDPSDKKWQKEKEKYLKLNTSDTIDASEIRYRDWNTLKYLFRSIEKNAPWVNRVHFITNGTIPSWLNTNNPKINIVKHSDYMPSDSLPTFNSNAIEIGIHKIKGLEEKFVLFNDDILLLKKTKDTDFFKHNLPCNSMSIQPVIPFPNNDFYKVITNDVEVINKNFDYKECKKKNWYKYLSIKQGKYLFKTYPFMIYNKFPGFSNFHLPNAFLKSTFKEVWNKEKELLNKTVYSKFRDNHRNLTQWLFLYWQFAKGDFIQKCYKFGKCIKVDDNKVLDIIKKKKYHAICLLESDKVKNFNKRKMEIIESLEKIFPEKSSFER